VCDDSTLSINTHLVLLILYRISYKKQTIAIVDLSDGPKQCCSDCLQLNQLFYGLLERVSLTYSLCIEFGKYDLIIRIVFSIFLLKFVLNRSWPHLS